MEWNALFGRGQMFVTEIAMFVDLALCNLQVFPFIVSCTICKLKTFKITFLKSDPLVYVCIDIFKIDMYTKL